MRSLTASALAAAPDIPTVDEAGAPGVYVIAWYGMWMPKGTPKEVIAKFSAAVMEALADPAVKERLAGLGQDIPAARAANLRGAGQALQGRDRQVVADHQGRGHQARAISCR